MNESFFEGKETKPIKYSVVIPVYNEEESLKSLFSELVQALSPLKARYEIIFVDDASDDTSPQIMEDFRKEFPEVVVLVRLPERSGQTFAMRQGLDKVLGEVAFTLDADLQNDPADIPRLLEKMQEGNYDCVCGWRKSRNDKALKAILSKTGNLLQRMCTGLSVHDVSCTLRAYKQHCLPHVTLHWEGQHRFIPLCLSLQGYKVGEIVSNHRSRQYGVSKYSHKRIFRVITDFFRILKTGGKA